MSDVLLTIPHEIALAAQVDEFAARVELATAFYRDRKLSLGKARRFAGLTYPEFLDALAQRDIPLNYSPEDSEQDAVTVVTLLNEMGR